MNTKDLLKIPVCREHWCKHMPSSDREFLLAVLVNGFDNPDTLEVVETALSNLPIDLNYLKYAVESRLTIDGDDLVVREKMVELAINGIRRAKCPCSIMTLCCALWPLLMYPQQLEAGIGRMKHTRKREGVFNEDGTYI